MIKMNLVSVIIPCFNGGKTILKTIDSVKNQTWSNIEIIVVNDGSNDKNTLEILKQIKGIRLFNQTNMGLSAARNKGISYAKGKFILPLDDDDWIEENTIEHMIIALENKYENSFAFSNIFLEGEGKGEIYKSYNFFEQLFLNQIPYCILYKKRFWENIGGYDEKMKDGFEDWEFNIRLGFNGIFGVNVPKSLLHYNVSSTGMLKGKSLKIHSELWSSIQKKHPEIYNFSYLFKIWLKWRKAKFNHFIVLYIFLFLFHKYFPSRLFTFLFKMLYRIKNL